ncbi:MAG TPA: hypothetical protein VMK12_01735, partial [Anaeromyxobacteraceae bacterium]|nr:hypothetical protein [Anaeromyxobacteraceae bacterium]
MKFLSGLFPLFLMNLLRGLCFSLDRGQFVFTRSISPRSCSTLSSWRSRSLPTAAESRATSAACCAPEASLAFESIRNRGKMAGGLR